MKKEIKLGMEVRCVVSGFKGTVISRTEYLNGCIRYGVEPKIGSDGKPGEAVWIDEQQLEVVKAVTPASKLVPQPTGGPRAGDPGHKNPKNRSTPTVSMRPRGA